MIARGLQGVEFLVCNTDAQHLRTTLTENRVQMGPEITGGLGCGANPEVGCVSRHAVGLCLQWIADALSACGDPVGRLPSWPLTRSWSAWLAPTW
jgi:cell division protein FtsZ